MQIEATMTLGKLMARGGLKLMALVSCHFYKSVETSYVLFNFLISWRCSGLKADSDFAPG